jgi:putative ABC transport system permease protein
MRWLDATGARLRLLLGRRSAEARMEEEIRFHLEMETDRLVREEGLAPAEARRRALVAFGGVDRTREELREGRGAAWLTGLHLDVKLGGRMLLRHPVLTGASVLALAVAVALAASWFEFMTDLASPRLPLPSARQIVVLENRDLATGEADPRALHDFEQWRGELSTVVGLTAMTTLPFAVTTDDGRFATLEGVRVTSSFFAVAGVTPMLGRPLAASDFAPGAAPAVVLGYDAWQRLFDGDRAVLGRTHRLGAVPATVVGVMPQRFGFPLNHELWTPLQTGAAAHERRAGPAIRMVGRLASGATLAQARAELAAIGQRTSADHPVTHAQLRPAVRRYAGANDMAAVAVLMNVPFLLFLVVVSANVATLLLARTLSRQGEIALRSALGASRRRIIVQLAAEALVLTSLAAVLGLALAAWGRGWGMALFWEVQEMRPPFWFTPRLSPATVVYAALLAIAGAFIVGGIPALRATGRGLRGRLPQPGVSGSGASFGRVATGVIIAQVAICVAFLPLAILEARELFPERRGGAFPAGHFLTGRLEHRADGEPAAARGALLDEAFRRLAAEEDVLAAARTSRIPGFNHPAQELAFDDATMRPSAARSVAVDANWFDVVGARIVAGRGFRFDDTTGGAAIAIVDESWALEHFGGRNAVGRRFRYLRDGAGDATRWYEIVGVVADVEPAVGPGTKVSLFHPLRPAAHEGVVLYLRTAGAPAAFAPAVQDIVASTDEALVLTDLRALEDVWRPVLHADRFFTAALGVVAGIILLFVLMGIYAMMSFSVEQRIREIGIRTALGADPRRIVCAIFSRAALQIGAGVGLGAVLISLSLAGEPDGLSLVGGVAAAVVLVGLLACALPARRALRVQPTQALRAE